MANRLTVIRYTLYALVVLIAIAFFDYWVPNGAVGRIGGTEVKRMDTANGKRTHDVRYITMELRESQDTFVLANEDSILYFLKLDSATIQGQAQNLATRSEPVYALVRYYGWRIPLLSMFPNVLSVQEVPADYGYTPWARIIVGILILIALFEIARRYRRWKRRREAAHQAEIEQARQEKARLEAEARRDPVDEFINNNKD